MLFLIKNYISTYITDVLYAENKISQNSNLISYATLINCKLHI
jgi:hypothetical protein